VNVFLWHIHGSYTTAMVRGRHRYLVPVLPDRGPNGRGRAQTYEWPAAAEDVTPRGARDEHIDVAVLQRPEELDHLFEEWTGRVPGKDVPAIYLEHNAPQGRVTEMRHPAADRPGVTLVHVTNFNALMWDSGATPVRVIEHGIVDPGDRYTGELPRVAAVMNEPGRRGRVVGADLIPALAGAAPVDVFGMGTAHDVPQSVLHTEMARRRVYVHPYRWTSLGLSLIEAMQLGMPVVALATTEVPSAVPAEAGVVTNRVDQMKDAMRWLVSDPVAARRMGREARRCALRRYGLKRFLRDWDAVFEEVRS
jgi:glycosyltransferase involved in cell wall biosynthesis